MYTGIITFADADHGVRGRHDRDHCIALRIVDFAEYHNCNQTSAARATWNFEIRQTIHVNLFFFSLSLSFFFAFALAFCNPDIYDAAVAAYW